MLNIMSNITEDLRRYRELGPVFDQFLMRELCEMIGDRVDPDWPESDDPRIAELYQLEERLENLSIESDSLVIEDRELYQLLGRLRKTSVDSALNEWGGIVSDDLYEKLLWEYHPRYFVQRMLKAPPLTTLIELPDEVIDLLAEARKAFCLRLHTACISVCRSTVERAVVDIAVRIGRLKPEDAPELLRMCDKISSLIAADLTPQSPLRRGIDQFIAESSHVIHTSLKADEPLALELYIQTLELIKMLYGNYASQLRK